CREFYVWLLNVQFAVEPVAG
ncbi:hypothetical protein A2U01_0116578, partial [Trifolium medium]|nr:hypothetical protein [Trifolium medium]